MVVKQRYSLWCRKYSFMNHVNREPLQTRLENWELHFTLLDHLTDRLLSFLENHHHQIESLVANHCFQCFLDRQPFELTKSDKSMQDKFCSLLGKKWSSNLREIGLERQSRILSADYSLLLPPGSNDKDTPFFTSLPFMNRLKYFICFQQNWLTLHCSWLLGTTSITIIVINYHHDDDQVTFGDNLDAGQGGGGERRGRGEEEGRHSDRRSLTFTFLSLLLLSLLLSHLDIKLLTFT